MATNGNARKQTTRKTSSKVSGGGSARKPKTTARSGASRTTGSASKKASGSRRTSGTAASRRSSGTAAPRRTSGTAASRGSSGTAAASHNGSSRNGLVGTKIVRSAVGAVVGGAAIGVAGLVANRRSKPRLLGIAIPDELNPQRLDPKKLANQIDLKDVVRHIGNFAEQVEARSEHVRILSGQAKALTRRMT
ncbi:MAG TPA: hypothetical protein VGG07_15140 [Solirubrobacteraceae bacterium]